MKEARLFSPLGLIRLQEEAGFLTALTFEAGGEEKEGETALLQEAVRQLQEYFAGQRRVFSLPIRPQGTPFQQRVWQGLLSIPYGATCSYAQLAIMIGSPRACRAVGGANGKNPLPILIPCHRVIGADGGIGGFSSGIEKKKILLALEEMHVHA